MGIILKINLCMHLIKQNLYYFSGNCDFSAIFQEQAEYI